MANFIQLNGNINEVTCVLNTLVEPVCGFENAYEFEDLDDQGMIRLFPDNIPAANYQVLLTSLYYRLQDPLFAGIKCNVQLPEPAQNVFRITASANNASKVAEDFFIYNNIEKRTKYFDLKESNFCFHTELRRIYFIFCE